MSTCSDARRAQRGNVLLEALVSVAVTGLIGAGLAHVASGVMTSQRDAKVEQLAVASLRGELQTTGTALCSMPHVPLALLPPLGDNQAGQVGADGTSSGSGSGSGSSTQADVTCAAAPDVTVTIGSEAHVVTAPQQVKLSVAATALGVRDAAADAAPLQVTSGS